MWNRAAAIAAYLIAVLGSSVLVIVLLYRAVTFTYRLTDRAVLIDKGPLSRHLAPFWLEEVTEVSSGAGWIGRLLGVGWVRIATAPGRSTRMTGVRDPDSFARRIREEMERVKQAAPSHFPSFPRK